MNEVPMPNANVITSQEAQESAQLTATQKCLLSIWGEILRIESHSIDQTFLALGGTSLSAIQIMARVREALGMNLPLPVLFDVSDSSIRKVAEYVDSFQLSIHCAVELPRDATEDL
jgi:acyl carrier protein